MSDSHCVVEHDNLLKLYLFRDTWTLIYKDVRSIGFIPNNHTLGLK